MPIALKFKPTRHATRHAEVDREFRHAQDDTLDPGAIQRRGLYMGPWREKLADGSLGPWYGPASEAAYERERRSYEDKREAGSLWDDEMAAQCAQHESVV